MIDFLAIVSAICLIAGCGALAYLIAWSRRQ